MSYTFYQGVSGIQQLMFSLEIKDAVSVLQLAGISAFTLFSGAAMLYPSQTHLCRTLCVASASETALVAAPLLLEDATLSLMIFLLVWVFCLFCCVLFFLRRKLLRYAALNMYFQNPVNRYMHLYTCQRWSCERDRSLCPVATKYLIKSYM